MKRVRWTKEEKTSALRAFGLNIKEMKLPSFKEIQKAIDEHPILKGRTLPQIKTWLHNHLKRK